MITGTPKIMTISSCCQRWTTDLGHHLPTKSVVEPTCGINSQGPTHLQGLQFYDFLNFVNFYFGVNTQKMAFLVKNECKKSSSNWKIGAPWGLWHFSSNYTGTSWLYMANCRVFEVFLKTFNKSSIYFAFFWSNFKIFPLAFEASKPKKKCPKMQNPWITHFFIY